MIVGLRQWELHLEGCQSLKDKRSVLQRLKAALQKELNVSVAETGSQDLWQRAEIACAAVGSRPAGGARRPCGRRTGWSNGRTVSASLIRW